MTDTIRLTVPSGRSYHGVVRLVLGGLAAQSGLSVEALEDVHLALDTLLADDFSTGTGNLDVEINVADGGVAIVLGPLDRERIAAALADRDPGAVGLARLLDTTTSGYEIDGRDGAAWVRLRKGVIGDDP
jgi:hypothetical protein